MKIILTFVSICLLAVKLNSQTNYMTKILILSSNKILVDSIISKDFKENSLSFNKQEHRLQDYYVENKVNNRVFEDKTKASVVKFLSTVDYKQKASLLLFKYLQNLNFINTPNLQLNITNQVSDKNLKTLQNLALQEDVEFIVNISSIHFTKVDKKEEVEIDIQVYENSTKSFIYDEKTRFTYVDFLCENNTPINCSLETVISNQTLLIKNSIAKRNPSSIKNDSIRKIRGNILRTKIESTQIDNSILDEMNLDLDKSVSKKAIKIQLLNQSKDKCISYFVEDSTNFSRERLDLKNSNDKEHNYKNNIYSYFIIGSKVNGVWKYKKTKTQCVYAPLYFEKQNIIIFHSYIDNYYFIKDSVELNPDFFNSTLFD